MNGVKKFRKSLGVFLLFIFVALMTLSFYSGQDKKGIFGNKGVVIYNDDLIPKAKKGDVGIIKVIDFDTLIKDDYVSYVDGTKTVTSKIIDKVDNGYKLQNGFSLKKEFYMGKLIKRIPYLGYFFLFIENPIVFYVLSTSFILFILYNLVRNLFLDRDELYKKRENKNKKIN